MEIANLQKDQAKAVALARLRDIIDFLVSLDQSEPRYRLQQNIKKIEELRYRIELSRPPLRSEHELQEYFPMLTRKIVNLRPAVSKQLLQFMRAHLDIQEATARLSILYSPTENLDEKATEIVSVANKSSRTISNFMNIPNDEISIYGLFFIHILIHESITKHILDGFSGLLKKCGLKTKYNAAGIFSVDFSIKTKNNDMRSDAEIIRHCLAHNKFDINFKDESWEIRFDNVASTYVFRKTYTRDQFVEYLYNYDILYRSTWMITDIIIAKEVIYNHLIENIHEGNRI